MLSLDRNNSHTPTECQLLKEDFLDLIPRSDQPITDIYGPAYFFKHFFVYFFLF